jgi:DNA processing protein
MTDANDHATPGVPDEFSGPEFARELAQVTPELERQVGITRDDLASLLLLEGLRGFGPQKFKELHDAGLRPVDVLLEPSRLPTTGKRGDAFRKALHAIDAADRNVAQARAVRQLVRADQHHARIVTYADRRYPPNVLESNNPIPVLYVRGDMDLLAYDRVVACVGSRETAPPYSDRHYEFATYATRHGFSIASGFALGADTIGHRAAFDHHGATVLVMPCGLDRPFPPENRRFFEELTHYARAVAVSEFSFGTAASALTLRKRNKLIVAFAKGVMLSQTSAKGGAMNAYRFALEQHKPVATFAPNGEPRTSGNELIARGGAERARAPARRRPQAPAAVFEANKPDPPAWDAWLQRLSSST